MSISDNELIRELVTGGLDERAAKAILTRLNAASSAPKIQAFPFAFDSAGISTTGHEIYTPTVGDLLLDAWVEIATDWDTEAFLDLSSDVAPPSDFGWFGLAGVAGTGTFGIHIHGGTPDQTGSLGANLLSGQSSENLNNGEGPSLLSLVANIVGYGSFGGAVRTLPSKFVAADPVKVWVTANGKFGGADPGATAGAAVLYLVTATPATA